MDCAMDCALFACSAVEALTGKHPYPEFLGVYSDRIGAAKCPAQSWQGNA
jgi:hypothetical protein